MIDRKNITAIILAGGKSSRMGTDKGLVDFNGQEMITYVLQHVKVVANDVLIISNHTGYEKFGYPVCEDIHKNQGPLGGIHAGLLNSKTAWNLVIGCDLPFVTKEFLAFLVSSIAEGDALVPIHDSFAEPLCALYHQSSFPKIESLLLKQELKMQTVVKELDTIFIEVPTEIFNSTIIFRNINRPEDLSSNTNRGLLRVSVL